MNRGDILKKVLAVLMVGAAFLLVLAAGCRRDRMNVVIIVIDTLRQDHLSLYGYERENAPFISRIGERGAVMDGLSTTSWTKPASASLLTGLHPLRHQAIGRTDALPDEVVTLAEILSKKGYQTNGISANGHVSAEFGFDQGFDQLRVVKRPGDDSHANSHLVNSILLPAVGKLRSPFFLYIHYIDPHYPYVPERAWDGSELERDLALRRELTFRDLKPSVVLERDPRMMADVIDLYDGEIRQVDGAMEDFFRELDKVGKLKNTLFVITADHGEEFQEHGMMSHGQTLYEEVTRVPLIFYAPGRVVPGRRQGTAILEDVMPTVLEMLSISVDSQGGSRRRTFDGISVAGVLKGEDPAVPDRGILLHLDYIEPTPASEGIARTSLAFLDAGRKLVFTRFPFRKELFDLNADPGESRNLLVSASADGVKLREKLLEMYHRLSRVSLRRRQAEVDEEMKESLRALGYLSGTSSGEIRSIPRRLDAIDLTPDGGFGWERLANQNCISASQLSSEPNLLDGWHYADLKGRWTMKIARFQVANARVGDSILRVNGANWNRVPVRLTVSLGNNPLKTFLIEPGQLKLEVAVPQTEGPLLRFQLEVDKTFSPAATGGHDIRQLGVFIHGFCLEPAA